jgi:hypothetical protein
MISNDNNEVGECDGSRYRFATAEIGSESIKSYLRLHHPCCHHPIIHFIHTIHMSTNAIHITRLHEFVDFGDR